MNNSTSSETDLGKERSSRQDGSPALLAFYIIILVIGLIENSLVLVVIFGKKESKTVNDTFIANLTISDIIFIIFASPLSIYMYFVQRYASIFVCKFAFPLITTTFIVSVATVASMAMQRCYAILNPFKPRIKRQKLITWLTGIWVLSFLLATPQMIATKVSPTQSCYEEWPSKTHPKLYTVALFTLQYVFPLIIISVSYIRIGMHVSKSNDNSKKLGTNIQSNRRAKDETAVKRTIIVILVLFLLCMLPNQVAYLLLDFGSLDHKSAARTLFKYTDIPTYLHCCVNPIIYGTVNRQFREGYVHYVSYILHFCSGKRCSNKSDHSSKDCLADDLALRKNRGLKREDCKEQVLMEDDYEGRRQNENERGCIDDGSSRNAVHETSL